MQKDINDFNSDPNIIFPSILLQYNGFLPNLSETRYKNLSFLSKKQKKTFH